MDHSEERAMIVKKYLDTCYILRPIISKTKSTGGVGGGASKVRCPIVKKKVSN